MKGSKYNLIFPLSEQRGEYIIYNSLSGSVGVFDKEMKDLIVNLDLDAKILINDNVKNGLISAGFFVDDNIDETKIFEVQYNARKYSSQELWFTVMTTYACNLACPYCYQGGGKLQSGMMSRTDADAIINFIKNYTIGTGAKKLTVLLFGGEPLLNFKEGIRLIDKLDSWAKKVGIDFGMGLITNGTLFNREMAQEMSKYKQRVHQITLDGPKNIHDRRRIYKNGKGTYDDIIKTLELFTELEIENLLLRIDVDKDNVKYLRELFEDLKARGLQQIQLGFGLIEPKTQVCSAYSQSCIVGEESMKLIPDLWKLAIEEGFDVKLRPQTFFVYCGAQTNFSFVVDPKGDLYKCSNFVGLKDHRIGSINHDGKLTNLRYEYFDWMSRNPLNMEKCRKCNIIPLCGGGCAGLAYTNHGTFHKEKCGQIKYLIECQTKLYLKQKFPKKFGNESYIWD